MLISKKKGFNDNKIEDLLRKEKILLKEDKYPLAKQQIKDEKDYMANIGVERRKHNRIIFETIVELKLLINVERDIISGRVKDISLGGLKFESCQELSINDVIVSFGHGSFLGGSEIKGRITRVVKDKLTYLYGMEFQELKLWEKAKIWYKTVTK